MNFEFIKSSVTGLTPSSSEGMAKKPETPVAEAFSRQRGILEALDKTIATLESVLQPALSPKNSEKISDVSDGVDIPSLSSLVNAISETSIRIDRAICRLNSIKDRVTL